MNQRFWSNTLIRLAALFGAIGAGLGAHMAGAGSYALKPIHAHILVAGWLTVFAWGIFYRVVEVRAPKLAITHAITGIIGSIGLTGGMWLEFLNPLPISDTINLLVYIIGGSILLLSFILFFLLTFFLSND